RAREVDALFERVAHVKVEQLLANAAVGEVETVHHELQPTRSRGADLPPLLPLQQARALRFLVALHTEERIRVNNLMLDKIIEDLPRERDAAIRPVRCSRQQYLHLCRVFLLDIA